MLDQLLRTAGRNPSEVKRTVMLSFTFGRDMTELDSRLRWRLAIHTMLVNPSIQ